MYEKVTVLPANAAKTVRGVSPALSPDRRHQDATLRLLAAMIVCDGRALKSELAACQDVLHRINPDIAPTDWMGRLLILLPDVVKQMRGPNRRRWLSLQLIQLNDCPWRDKLESQLFHLAIADAELHVNEAALFETILKSRRSRRRRATLASFSQLKETDWKAFREEVLETLE